LKIATIEKIISIDEHPNATALELVTVLGWQVVCKKEEFKPEDLVVYINIDSIVDPHPSFDFLASKNYRIKPIRLRGQISQGICFPIKILEQFPNFNTTIEEGTDVSNIIKARHYEKPVPLQLAGNAKGNFPNFLIKTDEDNLRNYPASIIEVADKEVYITQKIDGSSGTFFVKDGVFGSCSRNLELQDGNNAFWNIVRKYKIDEKLSSFGKDICIQGEVYGQGIQDNPTGIKDVELAVFNLYFISENRFSNYDELLVFCNTNAIPIAPLVYRGVQKHSIQDLIDMAKTQKYQNGKPAEGLVLRPIAPCKSIALGKSSWSVKILNEMYGLT